MRFMVIIKADARSEAGDVPSAELAAAMGRYNAALVRAGVLLAAEGLHPSSRGARIKCGAGGTRTVSDGPFPETEQLIAGFWLIDTKSRAEAIEWVKRCPVGNETELELRQVADVVD